MGLLQGVLSGDHRSVAKALSHIENDEAEAGKLLRTLHPHTGRAYVVGVTGPPGTGKSTLIDKMIAEYRKEKIRVGVLAFDPTSPLSGGALLGDRLRMLGHTLDPAVFIRSMASRGKMGGLTRAARNALRVLDAAGKEIIIVETVGTGQGDVDITRVADATIVTLMPELGDEVQLSKAGLMEIGDIFVVNKADLPHADRLLTDLRNAVESRDGWSPPILATVGSKGKGVKKVLEALERFRDFAEKSGWREKRIREKLTAEVLEVARDKVERMLEGRCREGGGLKELVERVRRRKVDPATAADLLLSRVIGGVFKKR